MYRDACRVRYRCGYKTKQGCMQGWVTGCIQMQREYSRGAYQAAGQHILVNMQEGITSIPDLHSASAIADLLFSSAM